MLKLIDEVSRECLVIRIDRKLRPSNVVDILSERFISMGVLERIRSDNGLAFIAAAVRKWIAAVGAKTATIEPGSP